MKKFFVNLMCAIMLVCATIGLTACGDDKTSNQLPDLADCEIGYQMPIYPSYEFDYQVSEDCVVHIKSITMTLIEKRTISPNELLTDKFQPYIFELNALGSTDVKFAGKTIYLRLLASQQYKTEYYYSAVIQEDGAIHWKVQQNLWCSASNLFFHYVDFGQILL